MENKPIVSLKIQKELIHLPHTCVLELSRKLRI